MIKPHGSDELNPLFVYDAEKRHALVAEAEGLPSILLNSAAAANAVMLGGGYFNPLPVLKTKTFSSLSNQPARNKSSRTAIVAAASRETNIPSVRANVFWAS